MKAGAYFVALLLGAACVALSVTLYLTAQANQGLQAKLQERQQQLSSGVLGPQAQQISGSVLQEMANAAANNPDMRKLLERHGYNVQLPETPASAALEAAGAGGPKPATGDAPAVPVKDAGAEPAGDEQVP